MVGRDDMLAALAGDGLLAEFSLWSADLVRIADDVAGRSLCRHLSC